MDIVYICKPGDNEELRYSIRSVVKNLPHSNIWVVGGKPDWYVGNHIPVDQSKAKYVNAKNNLRAIYSTPAISESFVLMNDDFYVLNKVESIPYMHGGFLSDKIDSYNEIGITNYTKMLMQTESSISRKVKHKVINYELHVPMVMEKKKLSKIMLVSGLWRSVYGNLYEVGGVEMEDVKVYGPGFKQKSYDITNLKYDYLSSDDSSFDLLYNKILMNLFPEPTSYEL